MKVNKITTAEDELDITGATLLSAEEAEKLPLRLREYDKWWWLRSPGFYHSTAAGVTNGGSVYYLGRSVYADISAVRPALKISNLMYAHFCIGDSFIFGGEEFEIVDYDLAFCKSDIGFHRFDEKSNVYEESDIKRYIDKWFEEAKSQN